MLRRSLAESDGRFRWPAEFENVANPDFKNLKHLQNPGHLKTDTSVPLPHVIPEVEKVTSEWQEQVHTSIIPGQALRESTM